MTDPETDAAFTKAAGYLAHKLTMHEVRNEIHRRLGLPEYESDKRARYFDQRELAEVLVALREVDLKRSDSDDDPDTPDPTKAPGPWWCPWCEAVIAIDGDVVTTSGGAYWHAYDHREKGQYAVEVMDAFEQLDVFQTEQHKMEPPDGDDDE